MTLLGDWGWSISTPKHKIQAMSYFPKVAVAELNMPITENFRSTLNGLEVEVDSTNPETVRFLVWDKVECERLTDALQAHQRGLPMEWASMDFCAELPVEFKSLQFYDADDLDTFRKAISAAHVQKLEPEQITDLPPAGAIRPKVFFYGNSKFMPSVVNRLFGKTRQNPMFRTYGYGTDPDMYDHFYSADWIAEVIARDRSGADFCFDAVVTTIATEFVGFMEAVLRDQKKDLDWADARLKPGGLLVLYAKATHLKYHLGTLVNRFEDFSATYPAAGYVVLVCTKKLERFRDEPARDVLEEVVSFTGNQWDYPNAAFINAKNEKVYTIAGDPTLDPAVFTRWMGAEYISRFCTNYPFRALSKIFKRADKEEITCLVTTPSVTQLTKLRLRGTIQGRDGEVVVTKQTDETVTTEKIEIDYDEDGEEKATRRIVRTRKRVRQISLVVRSPKRNLDTNLLRKGDAIVVDAA